MSRTAVFVLSSLVASAPLAQAAGWNQRGSSLELRVDASGQGAVDLTARTAPLSLYRVALRAAFEASAASATGMETRWLGAGLRAELPVRTGVAWLEAGTAQDAMNPSAPLAPVIEAGAGQPLGPVTLWARLRYSEATVPAPPVLVTSWVADTIPQFHWQPQAPRQAGVTMLQSTVSWERRRWALELGGGIATGARMMPVSMASVRGTRWLTHGVGASVLLANHTPEWLTPGHVPPAGVQAAISFAPERMHEPMPHDAPASVPALRWRCKVETRGGDLHVIRLEGRASHATVRGDFTGWEPVPLEATGLGLWELRIHLTPGVHQLEISVDDGAWQPPPGLPRTAGPYGGDVGVIVAS
jgi:hypothetical protein